MISFNNCVIPRKDTGNFKKGKHYPIMSFSAGQYAVAVQDGAGKTNIIALSDTDFVIIFNADSKDAYKMGI